jgi:hypothetical protein
MVLDYRLRLSVSANLNTFFLYQLPVPRLPAVDPRFGPLVRRAAQLVCTTPEFDVLAQAAGLQGHQDAVTDPDQRVELRGELDALVAHLYGLTEAEFAHVLETFPNVKAEAKAAALTAFRAQQPDPDATTIEALIFGQGEGRHLEFKCGAYHNPFHNRYDDTMLTKVVETVASFLNSPDGGTLLLGVADKPLRIVGIEDDLVTGKFTKQAEPEDAYGLAVSSAITGRLGGHIADLLALNFLTIQGHRVCRIAVQSASSPVYLNGELYIRGPKGKLKLNAQAATEYVKQRFKS